MKYVFIFYVYFFSVQNVQSGFMDYFPAIKAFFSGNEGSTDLQNDAFDKKIPYEVSSIDETFIKEAAKLTGVTLSDLDSCEQRVVLKLKSDCYKMNDDQLAKIAVHLLNCQSFVEGRPTFACTDEMSIKDCTKNMNSDTWTRYHLMSNRARAVCYTVRQSQFRGLAEHTVNKLMDAAQTQLRTLVQVVSDQEKLQDVVGSTFDTLKKEQGSIYKQQQDLQKAQFHGQLAIEDNIRRLLDEKRLILEAQEALMKMTEDIQTNLEKSLKQVEHQSDESRLHHDDVLKELLDIQRKTKDIFENIDASSNLLLKQNNEFRNQYSLTMKSLKEMNETIHSLICLVDGTRQALEERLSWIITALGGTDIALEKIYLFMWHLAFILLGMLICAFLGASVAVRCVVTTLPPLNLALGLYSENHHLDALSLLIAIGAVVGVQTLLLSMPKIRSKAEEVLLCIKEKLTPKSSPTRNHLNGSAKQNLASERSSSQRSFTYSTLNTKTLTTDDADQYVDESVDYDFTPPLSRMGDYSISTVSRSRSRTPLHINTGLRGSCKAKTRLGTSCKLSSLPGRDFCHRHQGGDSVIS